MFLYTGNLVRDFRLFAFVLCGQLIHFFRSKFSMMAAMFGLARAAAMAVGLIPHGYLESFGWYQNCPVTMAIAIDWWS